MKGIVTVVFSLEIDRATFHVFGPKCPKAQNKTAKEIVDNFHRKLLVK